MRWPANRVCNSQKLLIMKSYRIIWLDEAHSYSSLKQVKLTCMKHKTGQQ
jgi:hypothetical protein